MLSIVLKTLFEALLVGFALWVLFNEDKFIVFEERLVSAVRRHRLKVCKQERRASELRIYGE